jgi:hypothetical protein
VQKFEEGYRIVGHIVTATNLAQPNFTSEDVYWWNISTHTSGVLVLPPHEFYVDASPSGFLFVEHDVVYNETTAGVVTTIGTPLAGAAIDEIAGTTHGFVVSATKGRAAYYDYATKAVTKLKTGTTFALGCGPAVSGHIACAADHILPSERILYGADLLSLAGKPAIFIRGVDQLPVVSKGGMTWAQKHHLHTMSVSGTLTVGKARVDDEGGITYSGVSGAGSVVFTRGGQTAVTASSGAGRPIAVVRAAPLSPVAVSSYAIGGGRVAWRDDSGPNSVNVIEVARISHGVVSSESTAQFPPASNALAVSGSILAYGAKEGASTGLEIKSSAGHSEFVKGITSTDVQVSGTQVLYIKNRAAHPGDPLGQVYVYDASTGVTKKVGPLLHERAAHNTAAYFRPAALSDGRVVYQERNGTVEDEDLATGVTEKLRGKGDPAVDEQISEPQVFALGDYAGWNQGVGGSYRDVVTMAPAVTLTEHAGEFDIIKAMTDAGIVYVNSVRGAGDTPQVFLAPYGGTTGPLLLSGEDITVPLIADGSVIWVDRDDQLEAAAHS